MENELKKSVFSWISLADIEAAKKWAYEQSCQSERDAKGYEAKNFMHLSLLAGEVAEILSRPQPDIKPDAAEALGAQEYRDLCQKVFDWAQDCKGLPLQSEIDDLLDIVKQAYALQNAAPIPDAAEAMARAHELIERIDIQCKAVGRPVGGLEELKHILTTALQNAGAQVQKEFPMEEIKKYVNYCGGQKEAAEMLGISVQFLNDMLHCRRHVSERVASKFGFEKAWIRKPVAPTPNAEGE